MCENDAAVDRYIIAYYEWSTQKANIVEGEAQARAYFAVTLRAGHFQGVIRELAATVPGVREWLIEHMPGVG